MTFIHSWNQGRYNVTFFLLLFLNLVAVAGPVFFFLSWYELSCGPFSNHGTVLATFGGWVDSGPAGLRIFLQHFFSPLVVVVLILVMLVFVYFLYIRILQWRLRRAEVLHALYREQEDKKYLLELIRESELAKIRA